MNTIFDAKLKVLDLSMGWAGPLVGQMFAEMGADVIKVEDTNHFDWWRGSLSMAPPEMQPIERSAVFNTANRGKRGVTLDLAEMRGIEILRRLIEVSDLLIDLSGEMPVLAIVSTRILFESSPLLVVPLRYLSQVSGGKLMFDANPTVLEKTQPFDLTAWAAANDGKGTIYRYDENYSLVSISNGAAIER